MVRVISFGGEKKLLIKHEIVIVLILSYNLNKSFEDWTKPN